MLFKLFNWVPVLFGLKVAGIASVAQVPEVVASERPAWIESQTSSKYSETVQNASNERVSSGTLETFLNGSAASFPTIDVNPVLSTGFVMRPLPANVQRPTARLRAPKGKTAETARYQPGQTSQANRPAARASLKREGKKVAKRVVTLQSRRNIADPAKNVIDFPQRPIARTTTLKKAA